VAEPGGDQGGRRNPPTSLGEAYRKASPYLSASTTLVGAVAGFTLLGHWVDKKVGDTTPWFTLLGALFGMTGGFVSFFRQVMGKGTRP